MVGFQNEVLILLYYIFATLSYLIKITFMGLVFFMLLDYLILVYTNVRDGFKKK